MTRRRSSARFLELPENRCALLAVHHLRDALRDGQPAQFALLYIHGPSGAGKTQLANALVAALSGRGSDLVMQRFDANDLNLPSEPRAGKIFAPSRRSEAIDDWRGPARDCDLLIIEDLQHLAPAAVDIVCELLDDRLNHGLATVLTARLGPQHLAYRGSRFSPRFASRLAGGLVCHLPPLQAASRLVFLREMAQQRQLAVSDAVLRWLSEHVMGTGRQLLAALERIEMLRRTRSFPRDDATLIADFQADGANARPDLQGIAAKVSQFFQVDAELLQSASRLRNVLLPRQISMYLARKLTGLSLEKIGAYFGGRDHTTVMHACRKVEQALAHDPLVDGSVRQIHAELA